MSSPMTTDEMPAAKSAPQMTPLNPGTMSAAGFQRTTTPISNQVSSAWISNPVIARSPASPEKGERDRSIIRTRHQGLLSRTFSILVV